LKRGNGWHGEDFDAFTDELHSIDKEYYATAINKQILFSDWYTHYKFFWQYQIDWVDEQKKFKFFRDKLRLSLMLWVALLLAGTGTYLVRSWFCL